MTALRQFRSWEGVAQHLSYAESWHGPNRPSWADFLEADMLSFLVGGFFRNRSK